MVGKQLCHETLDRTEKRTEGNAPPSYREHRSLGDRVAAASFPLGAYSYSNRPFYHHINYSDGIHCFPVWQEKGIAESYDTSRQWT